MGAPSPCTLAGGAGRSGGSGFLCTDSGWEVFPEPQASLHGFCPPALAQPPSLPRLAPTRVGAVGAGGRGESAAANIPDPKFRGESPAARLADNGAPPCPTPAPPSAQGLALVWLEFPESAVSEWVLCSACRKVTSAETCCAGCRVGLCRSRDHSSEPPPKWSLRSHGQSLEKLQKGRNPLGRPSSPAPGPPPLQAWVTVGPDPLCPLLRLYLLLLPRHLERQRPSQETSGFGWRAGRGGAWEGWWVGVGAGVGGAGRAAGRVGGGGGPRGGKVLRPRPGQGAGVFFSIVGKRTQELATSATFKCAPRGR